MDGKKVRLSDRILDALQLALEQNDILIADKLGRALEASLTRFGGPNMIERREVSDEVVEALDRVEALRRQNRGASGA